MILELTPLLHFGEFFIFYIFVIINTLKYLFMYTLRTIVKEIQTNQNLGNGYQVIERVSNYDEFSNCFELLFKEKHVSDDDEKSTPYTKNCYAFILYNNGADVIPLYKNQYNYIMTESGKTFSNLTFK